MAFHFHLASWLTVSGPADIRNFNTKSKYELLFIEGELIGANPHYVNVHLTPFTRVYEEEQTNE